MDCLTTFPVEVMDFDHRPGVEKKFNISNAGGRAWETIEAEIAKCDLVCANCHRLRTIERRQAETADQAWIDDQLEMFGEEDGT